MLESQPREPSDGHRPGSPVQRRATSARGFGSSGCRSRSAGPSRPSTAVAQTALARADHRDGPHTIGRGLGRLAPVQEPSQLPAIGCKYTSDFFATNCRRAGGRCAESRDACVSASRGRRSFGQREVQRIQTGAPAPGCSSVRSTRTTVGGRLTLRSPGTDSQRSAQRTQDDSRPYQGRGACDRRSLGQCHRRAPGKSRAKLVFRPLGKRSRQKMAVHSSRRAGLSSVAIEVRVHSRRHHGTRHPTALVTGPALFRHTNGGRCRYSGMRASSNLFSRSPYCTPGLWARQNVSSQVPL